MKFKVELKSIEVDDVKIGAINMEADLTTGELIAYDEEIIKLCKVLPDIISDAIDKLENKIQVQKKDS